MAMGHTALVESFNKFGAICQLPNDLFVLQNVVFITRLMRNECSAPMEIAERTVRRCEGFVVCIQQLRSLLPIDEQGDTDKLQWTLIKTYRMTPLSARSFSMDSSFNSSRYTYNY
jgi:hypothetical protein